MGAARQEADATHGDYVAPLNAGLAKVEVTRGSEEGSVTPIAAKGGAIQAMNYEAGSVEVSVSEGVTLTSSHGHGIEAALTDVGNTSGTITVTNAAAIKAGTDAAGPRHGITVRRAAGSGDVSVTNTGAVEAKRLRYFRRGDRRRRADGDQQRRHRRGGRPGVGRHYGVAWRQSRRRRGPPASR